MQPMRPATLTSLGILLMCVVLVGGCRRPDPNTPEGRAAIERDRRRHDEAEERKRAKQAAKERDRDGHKARATDDAHATPATPGSAALPAGASAGTCDASCEHYLQCRANGGNADAQQQCVAACAKMRLSSQQLSGFEQTDCASAIAIVEGQGGTQSGGAKKSSSSACTGCVWDGSSCIWMSQSNWGAGAYSGAYSSCDAACCRRR
jgi:hypothetical protein